jgi:hypothetical protein
MTHRYQATLFGAWGLSLCLLHSLPARCSLWVMLLLLLLLRMQWQQ